MPDKKKKEPVNGVSQKEARMYEHIKDSAKKRGTGREDLPPQRSSTPGTWHVLPLMAPCQAYA